MQIITQGSVELLIAGARVHIEAERLADLWLRDLRHGITPIAAAAPAKIGDTWQGGIYAGISLDREGRPCHLVLARTDRGIEKNWAEAKAWASGLEHEGHADWSLMNRHDGLVLFKNLRSEFDEAVHWTEDEYASLPDFAWYQNFSYGGQFYYHKYDKLRVRAVRRLVIQ
jgi:hypothetical protein